MRCRHSFILIPLFCFISSSFTQTPSWLTRHDSIGEGVFNPIEDGSGGRVPIVIQSGTGNPSMKSFPPGGTVVRLFKGDSTLETRSISGSDELKVIVEFKSPPLSTIHSVREKSPTPRLQSAMSATQGDHDRFKADLPNIDANAPPGSRTPFSAPVSTIRYEYLTALNGVALTTQRWVLDEIRKLPYVQSIEEDKPAQVFDDSSNALIGAPQFWTAYGLHADSVDIGIIDTGIDYFHEALGAAPFPNSKVVGGYDFINNDADPMDDNGHGTHVAGITAGYGPPPVNLRGVAFGARLWAFKVLNSAGQGFFSQIIAGVDRALDPDGDPATPTPISVLNLSIGGSGSPNDVLSRTIDNAVSSGIVCAVAAGNSGSGYYTINSPGGSREAITVGAVSDQDAIAYFSSRGPSNLLFAIKPDLVAPGFPVTSAKLGGGYLTESGTSMATPHVAGAAALLRQLHPTWTPGEIKANLVETTHDLGLDVWTQGHGRLDVFHAAQESVVIAPATLSFGFNVTSLTIWTSRDTLTVYNSKPEAEVLQFSTETALPAGIILTFDSTATYSLGAFDSVSVPVTLTVDNSVYAFPTNYPPSFSNKVIAQSTVTSERVSVPFAFIKSPIFNLHFNVPPTLVDIHNNRDSSFFNVAFSNIIGLGLSILVPVDSYDVATFFYTDSQMVITEGINVTGVTTVNVNSTDAKNLLNLRMMDINGHEITATRLALESVVSRRSQFGISLFGEGLHKKRYISDISANYLYEYSAIPDMFLVGNVFYEFPFVISNGIHAAVNVQNDPATFKRVDYNFGVPPLTTRLYLTSIFSSPTFGVGSTIATITPPFQMTAFYLPSPLQENFPYTQHWLTRNTHDILDGLLHRTGYVSVTDPDTLKFAWSPTGFHFGAAQFASTRSSFYDPVGINPPLWSGRVYNLGPQIDLQVATDSYFLNSIGERTTGPISYRTYSSGVPVDSGIIQNLPMTHLDTLLNVPGGPYELDAVFNQCRVGPRQSTEIARIFANSNNQGTICPRFRRIQFLRNGELPDSLPPNQLAIVPIASQGLDSITAFYRHSYDSLWIPLALTQHDSNYVAALPDTLPVGYYSTRIRITDNLNQVIDYLQDPGWAIPGTVLDTGSIVFDTIHVGCHQIKYIGVQNLRNVGYGVVESIVSDDSNFVVTGALGTVIPAADSFNCAVSFSPKTGGQKFGHIVFRIDGIASPETVFVSGVAGSSGGEVTISNTLGTRWQLISVPVNGYCPYIMPILFGFRGTYLIKDTLKPGEGYWKSMSDPNVTFIGFPLVTDTFDAVQGWNLFGTIATPVPTPMLITIPDGMIESRIFGYTSTGYFKPDSLMPTRAYWVKLRGACKLILSSSSNLPKKAVQPDLLAAASRLTITDAAKKTRTLYFGAKGDLPGDEKLFELPPVPPEGAFDVRFASNRECEVVGDRRAQNFPIAIRSAEYPVTISWDLKSERLLAAIRVGSGSMEMDRIGSIEIKSPSDTVVLRMTGGSAIPRTFALDQNYPNPFNPQTVIQYQLPVDSRVDLTLFNALGEEVASLVRDDESAGYKSVTWNAINFASGVYFCRLQAVSIADPGKTFTKVQKLVLIR